MSLWLTSFQTTEHGPALARRSQWVSVPGAPLRATLSNAFVSPRERRRVHVSDPLQSGLGRGPLFRGGRFSTDLSAGHYAGRDPLCNSTPRRVRSFVKASRMSVALGLFAWPNVLQDAPSALSEASESHSVTPFVRFQTSGNGGFLCDTISSEIETGRSQ